jgi:hypothetical protein
VKVTQSPAIATGDDLEASTVSISNLRPFDAGRMPIGGRDDDLHPRCYSASRSRVELSAQVDQGKPIC